MTVYEKNLKALGQHDPSLYDRVVAKRNDQCGFQIVAVDPIPLVDGATISANVLYGDDIWLLSPDAIRGSVVDLIDNHDYRTSPRLLIFNGMGLGYHPLYAFSRLHPSVQYVLVVEKEIKLFNEALKRLDLTPMITNRRCRFVVGEPEEALSEIFSGYIYEKSKLFLHRCIEWITLPFAEAVSPGYYNSVKRTMMDVIQFLLATSCGLPDDTLTGMINIRNNFETIIRSGFVDDWKDIFAGKPGLIISSGPSLQREMANLKRSIGSFVSICADSALQPLLNAGIRPNFVSTLERFADLKVFFEGLPDLADICLLACTVVHPDTIRAYPGPKRFIHRGLPCYTWFPFGRGGYNLGGSCSHLSFKVLQLMGCNPIVFVGQDLAFDPETGESHVRGVNHHAKRAKKDVVTVPGNAGTPIETLDIWRTFIRDFKSLIDQVPGRTYINATGTDRGAQIPGTVNMAFEDVIEMYDRPIDGISECVGQHPESIEPFLVALDKNRLEAKKAASQLVHHCHTGLDRIAMYDQCNTLLEKASVINNAIDHQYAVAQGRFFTDIVGTIIRGDHLNIISRLMALDPLVYPKSRVLPERRQLLEQWFRTVLAWTTRVQSFLNDGLWPQPISKNRRPIR